MPYDIPDRPFLPSQTGWSLRTLRTLLRRGEIRRVAWGVYAPAWLADSILVRAQALLLVLPPHAVACRSTAAWLYGIDLLDSRLKGWRLRLELAVVEGAAAIRRPGVAGFVQIIAEEDVCEIGGVRVTTPLRTAADLGRWLPRYDAIGALDAFLRSRLVTRAQLIEEAERWAGFKGVKQLRELVRFADPRAESPRESWLRLFIYDAGFPEAEPQVRIERGPGLEPYRLDLGIERLFVGFDYDGAEWHAEDRAARDDGRRAFIRSRGWTVIVVRRGDLERPQRLVDAIGMFVTPVRAARRGMGVVTGYVPPALLPRS